MGKRIVVLCDGTWNTPKDNTNVYRLYRHLKSCVSDDTLILYDPGVGSRWYSALVGGLFGVGVGKNIRQGYKFIADHYEKGDEIWLFGFSRGAFTARSLAGMLNRVGLVTDTSTASISQAYDLYRRANEVVQHAMFKVTQSRVVEINFIGVFDTVGALGAPGKYAERTEFKWLDTQLGHNVKHAYHAMALDEHRPYFDVTFWTESEQARARGSNVEQRWFVGAHANVGGGYDDERNALADFSLNWMIEKMADAKWPLPLVASASCPVNSKIANSLNDGLFGWVTKTKKWLDMPFRIVRRYSANHRNERAVNVTVDDSVWLRVEGDASYRPETLESGYTTPQKSAVMHSHKEQDSLL